ncbi:uncharacterized protein BHQ10_010334 [Talaromyces amestolkiae]|uniref:Uncharacterized protein n=1 Tax=Talaromyces amestolkiae TaxID=1196081 RepID=A0A364LEV8_TALAM|nr:uncharacterized protein BHQ10_010334 [Talaromyces amestolkiae]RAO74322.1 hypothetical protein BHQ10_010334 [Talaromyces amestolkiae]
MIKLTLKSPQGGRRIGETFIRKCVVQDHLVITKDSTAGRIHLVKYVENHGVINTHDDVPEAIREQLFAEERQQIDRRQKSPNLPASSSALPAININVLPTPSSQQLSCSYGDQSKSSRIEQAHSFKISESFEEALENYANWHLGRVSTVNSREHIIRARDIALEKCLDLQQIFIDNDPESFPGVAIGMARRFANDIPLWLEDREHRNGTEEPENE